MIAILHHHFTDISHSNFLPPCIADKLPARNFWNDKQANLIAPVHKILRLWPLHRPHRIRSQLEFQQIRIQLLR